MIKFSEIINESSSSKFKVGLDLHGVIDSLPTFFSFLSNAIVKSGGEVHVITGGSWTKKLENQLESYGIRYTHSFSVYDHLILVEEPVLGEVQFPDGTIQKKFNEQVWDRVKGKYCSDNNISLHIDDTSIYNENFTTPFARFWSHNNNPKASHKDVRHMESKAFTEEDIEDNYPKLKKDINDVFIELIDEGYVVDVDYLDYTIMISIGLDNNVEEPKKFNSSIVKDGLLMALDYVRAYYEVTSYKFLTYERVKTITTAGYSNVEVHTKDHEQKYPNMEVYDIGIEVNVKKAN